MYKHIQTEADDVTSLVRLVLRLGWPSLAGVAAVTLTIAQASASLCRNWKYSGNSIVASGTFVTNDTPDASGFYLITGITGTRNGETIISLQPPGTAIPRNEPYAVDNLVRLNEPQLTHSGFGYAISGGTYANPFFADSSNPSRYMEFFSAPSLTGEVAAKDSELPVGFAATMRTVAEPNIARCS